MKISVLFLIVTTLVFGPRWSVAQDLDPGLLEWTESVGVMLHNYHEAHRIAVTAVTQHGELPPLYAGGPYDGGWAFSFGELKSDSTFVLDYGVIVAPDLSITRFDVFDFDRIASVHHTLAAQALQVVMDDFELYREENEGFEAEAYRFSVLPFPRHQLTAFVSPAQTVPGFTLMGNSIMYRLDRSSFEIYQRTRLHHRILPMPDVIPGHAIAILNVPHAPIPTPVDVQNAIESGAPLVVIAEHGVFLIEADGTLQKLNDDDPMVKELRDSMNEAVDPSSTIWSGDS